MKSFVVPVINEEEQVVKIVELASAKKITGTRLAAVLGKNKYTSPFKVWMDIVGILPEETISSKYFTAGKVLEPKLLEFAKVRFGGIVGCAEWWGKQIRDAFPDDDVFGGIPDAYRVDGDNNIVSVIDFKATASLAGWGDRPPDSYMYQTALYAFKHGVQKFEIWAYDLSDIDLEDLEELLTLSVDENRLVIYRYDLEKDFREFFEDIECAEKWYQDHVKGKVSPKWEFADFALVEDIRDYQQKFSNEESRKQLERLNYLMRRKEMLNELTEEIDKEIKSLKEFAKPLVAVGAVPSVYGGLKMGITPVSRDTVDKDALKADGLFDKYIKQSKSSRFDCALNDGCIQLDKVQGLVVDTDRVVGLRPIAVRNGSLSEGLRFTFNNPFLLKEVGSWVVGYIDVGSSQEAIQFSFCGIKYFGCLVIVKKNLEDMSDLDVQKCMEDLTDAYKDEDDIQSRGYSMSNEVALVKAKVRGRLGVVDLSVNNQLAEAAKSHANVDATDLFGSSVQKRNKSTSAKADGAKQKRRSAKSSSKEKSNVDDSAGKKGIEDLTLEEMF